MNNTHVNFKVATAEEYFLETNRIIDWDEDNKLNVPVKQAKEIEKILATEASIYLLRGATGIDGSIVDAMVSIRRALINKYEKNYEKYIEYNDFY